jgi:hypothetical protein
MRTAEQIIRDLKMQPISGEGAWFAPGPRTQELSSITVLLTDQPDGFSAMHSLTIDEAGSGSRRALPCPTASRWSGVLNLLDERNR